MLFNTALEVLNFFYQTGLKASISWTDNCHINSQTLLSNATIFSYIYFGPGSGMIRITAEHHTISLLKTLYVSNPFFCKAMMFSLAYRKLHDIGVIGDIAFFLYKTSEYQNLFQTSPYIEKILTSLLLGEDLSLSELKAKLYSIDESIKNCEKAIGIAESAASFADNLSPIDLQNNNSWVKPYTNHSAQSVLKVGLSIAIPEPSNQSELNSKVYLDAKKNIELSKFENYKPLSNDETEGSNIQSFSTKNLCSRLSQTYIPDKDLKSFKDILLRSSTLIGGEAKMHLKILISQKSEISSKIAMLESSFESKFLKNYLGRN